MSIFIALFSTITFAAQVPLKLPGYQPPGVNLAGDVSRKLSSLTGGHDTCFLAHLTVANTSYLVQIDTGSTDTVLPHNNLNGYTGPTINYTIPVGKEKTISSTYGDGSFWWGYPVSMDVGLGGTNLNSSAPLSLMTSQSTAPIFASGKSYQGLMGVAFPALSNSVSAPYSVMDAWVANSVVSTNQIAFHGCPYTLETSSWIDFGNETPYKGCNNDQKAAVMMPSKTYYNINLAGIAVNGTAQVMPSAFQTGTTWSFMDSCTSNIMVPSVTLLTLQTLITNSGAISNLWMSSGYIGSWLNSNIMIPFGPNDLKWELLPNISFTINTQASATLSTVTLTLGPRQYIQANPSGYYTFMIGTWGDQYAVLGLPFFSAYHIVVDRDSGQISFQLGCNCENSPDGYPKISTFGQTILTASSNCTAADTTPAASVPIATQVPIAIQAPIGDYKTCFAGANKCQSPNFICCVAPLDNFGTQKRTCRLATDCAVLDN